MIQRSREVGIIVGAVQVGVAALGRHRERVRRATEGVEVARAVDATRETGDLGQATVSATRAVYAAGLDRGGSRNVTGRHSRTLHDDVHHVLRAGSREVHATQGGEDLI